MGVNAQTSVPAFTAGQVLTAAEMTEVNTGIPVFATTTTRDAAFGGTGEKVLAQGQYAYIEATSTLQVYTGSAWINAVSSGMNFISSTTIGSAVASVTVTGAFSSTYDNYQIVLTGGVASTGINLNLTLGSTATGYYWAQPYSVYSGSTLSLATGSNTTSFTAIFSGSTNNLSGIANLQSPNLAKYSTIYATTGSGAALWYTGELRDTTQYTAFTLTASSGTITGGTIRVYGYANS